MPFDFLSVVRQTAGDPLLCITVLLTLGFIFLNGCTDAPNAIATCVATRALSPKTAVRLSAVFNFLGVLFMTLVNASVAMTIRSIVNFDSNPRAASAALCAALLAIILWAVGAWYFGIPTSESHALIAGLSGAAIALQGGFGGINGAEWIKVVYGLLLSTLPAFVAGFAATRLIEHLFRHTDRYSTVKSFRRAQIFGGAAMSFMHGAQDGQKFMGVLLLGITLPISGESSVFAVPPLWMILLCSLVMSFGTSIGGYKIIKSVGMDMVRLVPYQGFAADSAAAVCLLISSLCGIPVSTTHAKTAAIMGVGASRRLSAVNLRIVRDMVLTWLLTFPGCGLIGFAAAKLFLSLFQ